jgi:pimeloyl-ACP methyl ester carboxylesterase
MGAWPEPSGLEGNGNASTVPPFSQKRYDEMAEALSVDKKLKKGYYAYNDYHFWYDWRLDPLEIADRLAEYIDGVLAVTGARQVAIISRCVGTNVAMAYAAKYGTEKIYGFGIDGTTTNGGEFLSDAISGKFKLDGPALERVLTDANMLGVFDVSEFAMASIDLLIKSGALNAADKVLRATIYDKIVEGATSAIALGTVFTMPCYWGFVCKEDYETAKNYVFGPEGGEKRQKYAGLIAKLDAYHETVRIHLSDLFVRMKKDGANVAIISKYGFQIVPICQSSACVSDQYASVASSSFGATTSDIFTRLDDDYIAGKVADGKGKYISPDKMIDASTCLFPDYTWFTKNISHSVWTWTENALLYTVITADRQYTVDDLVTTQFMVQDETGNVVPMTADNCDTERWEVQEENNSGNAHVHRVLRFLASFITWIKYLVAFVKAKLSK